MKRKVCLAIAAACLVSGVAAVGLATLWRHQPPVWDISKAGSSRTIQLTDSEPHSVVVSLQPGNKYGLYSVLVGTGKKGLDLDELNIQCEGENKTFDMNYKDRPIALHLYFVMRYNEGVFGLLLPQECVRSESENGVSANVIISQRETGQKHTISRMFTLRLYKPGAEVFAGGSRVDNVGILD